MREAIFARSCGQLLPRETPHGAFPITHQTAAQPRHVKEEFLSSFSLAESSNVFPLLSILSPHTVSAFAQPISCYLISSSESPDQAYRHSPVRWADAYVYRLQGVGDISVMHPRQALD